MPLSPNAIQFGKIANYDISDKVMEEIFRQDSYKTSCDANIIFVKEDGAILLDRSVFYPESGGQPGDQGFLTVEDGSKIEIIDCQIGEEGNLLIPSAESPRLRVGQKVHCEINWERRHRLMRMHTSLHLLCAVLPFHVNGCQIGEERSRVDFHVGSNPLDKEQLEAEINELIKANYPVSAFMLDEKTLDENPELVRTMSVSPPRGKGVIRFLKIGDEKQIDLQPCGGTHVKSLQEIGTIRIGKIESKGGGNKRINVHLA